MYFLLTAPHPDDDVIGLGDYLQHVQGNVGVWFMTDGGDCARRVEATRALNLLGVRDIFWNTLPFYEKKDRRVTGEDYDACAAFLKGIGATTIALCYDADPHQTHIRCFTILQHAIRLSRENLSRVVLYKSAWGNNTTYPQDTDDAWNHWKVRDPARKQEALECHESQLRLKVHDGLGDDLIARGNLEGEVYMEISVDAFCSLPPCYPGGR